MVSYYLKEYGNDDFILAYPGYSSRHSYKNDNCFAGQKFICDKLYDIKGNNNTGLFAHFMNPQEAKYMSFYLNKRYPNRYMFLDALSSNKQDHSKMIIFFRKEAYNLFLNFYGNSKISSLNIPSQLIKACVIGSSNQSDNTYLHHLYNKKADKGEADLFIVNNDFFGLDSENKIKIFINDSIINFIETGERRNDDYLYRIHRKFTASKSFDIGNGNNTLSDLFRNFIVEK